jgi:dipeptidyl aminopeptidase/acylaminoacyl peptidase
MKLLCSALLLALASTPALAAAPATDTTAPHPFNVQDLVRLDRVGAPELSPDGVRVAYTVRRTDYAANKGITSIYVQKLGDANAKPVQLVDKASSPRWSPDGKTMYYLSSKSGSNQLWAVAAAGGTPHQVSSYPVDVNNFVLSPDGSHVAVSIDVFTDCDDLACTHKRLGARKADPATGTLYTKMFVRHWDTWSDHRRSQLFVSALDGGKAGAPVWISKGIDGDMPSKPFGDESEYTFSPDGKTVYFDVRIAGTTEPWSTNFDVYKVPADGSAAPRNLTAANKAWDGYPVVSPDGKTLYYLAMKTPGFEADRFGIMAMDLASGKVHEVDPKWDRSPGGMQVSADGTTLYVTAPDQGQVPLFAVDAASGKVTQLVGDGSVGGYALEGDKLVFSRNDLKRPAALYLADAQGHDPQRITHFNDARLAKAEVGDFEFFDFKGWNGDTVQGFVVKPVGYVPGKKYPVAFIIHGGPQGAMSNGWSYRWNPQTYAGQGFAVVTVNFHGSVGYGQAFTDSISGDWGGKPLVDLQDGWKYALQKYDFLDGDRACALGASYGGYMTYWIAGVWNKPWKCFVDHDGVFDMRMMYYATEELWFEEHENGGPQFDVPANYEKFNPLDHVKNWRVPMLVVHSGHDFRIPLSQGLGAFTALQRQGIPSEFLTFPDESHWVLKPHNSVMWHNTVNAWLKRWTAPASASSAAPSK